MSKKYLGLDFFEGGLDDFLDFVFSSKNTDKPLSEAPKLVVTPNPEMIVEMKKNADFALVLRGADYRLVDGVGLLYAMKIWGFKQLQRITGTDFFIEFLKRNTKEKAFNVFLLGAGDGVADKVRSLYKKANIVGTYAPEYSLNEMEGELVCQKIINSKADIVFVAFGAPKQEIWMWKFKNNLRGVKFVIGVGGAFDYVAEEVERAPEWMRKYGLEWLYRLRKQPMKRLFRIYKAVFVFPYVFGKDYLNRNK